MLTCKGNLFSFIFTIKDKFIFTKSRFEKKNKIMILGKTKDNPEKQNTSASL